jgi:hypothetical protein
MSEDIDLVAELEDGSAATSLLADVMTIEAGFGRKLKSERLDGNAVQWVIVATATLTELPKILDAIRKPAVRPDQSERGVGASNTEPSTRASGYSCWLPRPAKLIFSICPLLPTNHPAPGLANATAQ